MQDAWPEFLYGGLSIAEYVQRVLSEDRGIKHEAIAIVDLIREVAKYPYPTPEETFQRISLLCRALRALLAQADS
jgi:hypothetical protein